MIFLSRPRLSPSTTSSILNQSIVKQIRYLLEVNHKPLVTIQKSNIPGAGTGVFYNGGGSLDKEEDDHHQHHHHQHHPQVVCLYPGIYTPGMPKTQTIVDFSNFYDDYHDDEQEFIKNECYLANKILPPSGISFDENAYIMNLPDGHGGYIDGHSCALEVTETETETTTSYDDSRDDDDDDDDDDSDKSKTTTTKRRRRRFLDENPSACGHLVNHCPTNYNIQLISFLWDDIIIGGGLSHNSSADGGSRSNGSTYFQLPNSIRNDGMEWYYDPIKQDIVRFPSKEASIIEKTKTNNDHHSSSSLLRLRGVALALSKPNIQSGTELLLNYGLIGPPYPNWARDWYNNK